jgi:hypothetical protein
VPSALVDALETQQGSEKIFGTLVNAFGPAGAGIGTILTR